MSEEDPGPIPIDIVGDLVCPSCFIGLRLVNAVVSSVPGLAVDVRWYPYQLDPEMAAGGMDRGEYLAKKYGADADDVLAKAQAQAQEFGLELAFGKIKRQPNTFEAHRLIRYSYAFGVQPQIVERIFQTFFLHGQDIGDRAVLIAIAAKSRLDPAAVEAFFAQSEDIDPLEKEMADIREAGVHAVPRFTFAGKEDIIGLQSAEVFADALFNSIEEG
ncbi:MAG TPA: DsbA family oxidoreductase [Beijerinckia sp.]|jgi:predicted DsbA family dithiol-disulfide isomerase|nr:DsbA family oxidoreductase [Beijerinckia sp.]